MILKGLEICGKGLDSNLRGIFLKLMFLSFEIINIKMGTKKIAYRNRIKIYMKFLLWVVYFISVGFLFLRERIFLITKRAESTERYLFSNVYN